MSFPARSQEPTFIARSEVMRLLEEEVNNAARSDAKVLITGETGVGKEVVARLIHQRSARARAGMVTLNCAGLPDSLLESELFGHTRGSFTGAHRDKPGLLEMAPNGTVFLDEVGEMSPRMQVVLLRFLETGEIQRVGADRSSARLNVRVITATNRDLEAEVLNGTFREDLFFRLNVIRISVPSLRERGDDIPALVHYYINWYSGQHSLAVPEMPADVLDALVAYRWPGNIRELRNVIERIVLKANGGAISCSDLPPEVVRNSVLRAVPAAAVFKPAPADELTERMFKAGESFWEVVYPIFMERDLTRAELRKIIRIGLETTNGNYRSLVHLFNMPPTDYKRFLTFLRRHDCHLSYQPFRVVPARIELARNMRNAG